MTSRVKKILSIVIISVIVLITALTVILAIVPKRLYNPVTEGYYRVAVYKDGKDAGGYNLTGDMTDKEKDFKKKLARYLDESFKDNCLSSLFQGTGRYESKVISKNEENIVSNIAKASGAVVLRFEYSEAQKLIFNGKEYKNSQASDPTKTITFTRIYMPLSNDGDFQERIVYLTSGTSTTSSYQIKFLAHQGDLYNYISSLENDSLWYNKKGQQRVWRLSKKFATDKVAIFFWKIFKQKPQAYKFFKNYCWQIWHN